MAFYDERFVKTMEATNNLLLTPIDSTYKGIRQLIGSEIVFNKVRSPINALMTMCLEIGYQQCLIDITNNEILNKKNSNENGGIKKC